MKNLHFKWQNYAIVFQIVELLICRSGLSGETRARGAVEVLNPSNTNPQTLAYHVCTIEMIDI